MGYEIILDYKAIKDSDEIYLYYNLIKVGLGDRFKKSWSAEYLSFNLTLNYFGK